MQHILRLSLMRFLAESTAEKRKKHHYLPHDSSIKCQLSIIMANEISYSCALCRDLPARKMDPVYVPSNNFFFYGSRVCGPHMKNGDECPLVANILSFGAKLLLCNKEAKLTFTFHDIVIRYSQIFIQVALQDNIHQDRFLHRDLSLLARNPTRSHSRAYSVKSLYVHCRKTAIRKLQYDDNTYILSEWSQTSGENCNFSSEERGYDPI
uniref:Uncharacterized protein n=1 Tax=Glossina austeni TaxID=7395 RepID=A0A1A9UHP0_GLOAU